MSFQVLKSQLSHASYFLFQATNNLNSNNCFHWIFLWLVKFAINFPTSRWVAVIYFRFHPNYVSERKQPSATRSQSPQVLKFFLKRPLMFRKTTNRAALKSPIGLNIASDHLKGVSHFTSIYIFSVCIYFSHLGLNSSGKSAWTVSLFSKSTAETFLSQNHFQHTPKKSQFKHILFLSSPKSHDQA